MAYMRAKGGLTNRWNGPGERGVLIAMLYDGCVVKR